jgi:hypothetical protein
MTRLAHPVDAPVADDPADAVISGGKVLADGFRRYERFHVIRGSGANWEQSSLAHLNPPSVLTY